MPTRSLRVDSERWSSSRQKMGRPSRNFREMTRKNSGKWPSAARKMLQKVMRRGSDEWASGNSPAKASCGEHHGGEKMVGAGGISAGRGIAARRVGRGGFGDGAGDDVRGGVPYWWAGAGGVRRG